MLNQNSHRQRWIVFVFVFIAAPVGATEPINPLDRLASANSHSAGGMELAGTRDPSTVARLYLTVPETSDVLINGNRTRATGRDRYFEVPIVYDVPGIVRPTHVEVLQLTHHGAGQPEATGYQKYELSLISGTTTYFTAKPQKKKQEEAMDLKTLTAFMPLVNESESLLTSPASGVPVAAVKKSVNQQFFTGIINVRFKDDTDTTKRTPTILD